VFLADHRVPTARQNSDGGPPDVTQDGDRTNVKPVPRHLRRLVSRCVAGAVALVRSTQAYRRVRPDQTASVSSVNAVASRCGGQRRWQVRMPGAELAIHGGGLGHRWTVVVGCPAGVTAILADSLRLILLVDQPSSSATACRLRPLALRNRPQCCAQTPSADRRHPHHSPRHQQPALLRSLSCYSLYCGRSVGRSQDRRHGP
jgi:hypothetical protein